MQCPFQPSCDVNVLTNMRQTALHMASERGHTAVIEKLVGYGADMNAPAFNGTVPLHMAVIRSNMAKPTDTSPQIKKVNKNNISFDMT